MGYFGKVLAVWYFLDTPTGTALTADPTNTAVLRGSTVLLNCSADANPLAYLYQFYLNDTIIVCTPVFLSTKSAPGRVLWSE